MELLLRGGEELECYTLGLVWPGSLPGLICLDGLQKVSSRGSGGWRSESVYVRGLDIEGNPSLFFFFLEDNILNRRISLLTWSCRKIF